MEYGIKVTDIRMKIREGNGMKAICSITLNGLIALNDIRVIENRDGRLMIAMPSKKMGDGKFRDMANPVNAEGRRILEEAILEEYNRLTTLSDEFLELIA